MPLRHALPPILPACILAIRTLRSRTARLIAVAALALTATNALAEMQTYDLLLGQRQLGTLQFDTVSQTLVADLNNTPLGVADGRFTASVTAVRTAAGIAATQYLSQTDKRQISVLLDEGHVLDTTIAPRSEATDLSDPTQVPVGVVPPTATFGALAGAGGCPAPVTMYDGRRVVRIATTARDVQGADTLCTMDYRVTAGPGHLSPFRFRSLDMGLIYRDGALSRITLRAGGFEVAVARR